MNAVAVAAGRASGIRLAERFPLCSRGVCSVKGNRNSVAWHCNPTQKRKGKGMLVVVARVYRSKKLSRSQPESFSSDSILDPALDINGLRTSSVRLIDEEEKMVGIVSTSNAIQMAEEAELDLVILSSDADPPVVGIMDYRKYKYERQKKNRDVQKKSRSDTKELKMGCNIDIHDYDVRLRAAKKFLKEGDKVKIIVQFKGRERNFKGNAMSLFERLENDLGKMSMVESKIFEERVMTMVLLPNKGVLNKLEEKPSTEEVPNKGVLDKLEENPSTEEVSAGV